LASARQFFSANHSSYRIVGYIISLFVDYFAQRSTLSPRTLQTAGFALSG